MSEAFVLEKMKTELAEPVRYSLHNDAGARLDLNALIGSKIEMHFDGKIICHGCGRLTNKSFNQGYCYPCFKNLASCDLCIMKPETCHYHLGTCREPIWADEFCMQAHYVYLANSSGLKVGITRQDQLPTRWIDQGAVQALPLYKVSNRFQAGLVEVCLGQEIKDKTNWRAMLKGEVEHLELENIAHMVKQKFADEVAVIAKKFGNNSCEMLNEKVLQLSYPVASYPNKINSYNLDKDPVIEDVLQGIKGQYLIFSKGVINVRKFSAYQVKIFT